MTQLYQKKIHISLKLRVPHQVLEKHLASSAEVVGYNLTEQVVDYVNANKLGYFPALDFFQNEPGVDPDLMDAAETIGWFASKYAREEIQRKMRPFFSSISFQSVQTVAFTMPSVRSNQLNAWHDLLGHYTPDVVKLDLIASILKKNDRQDGLSNWSRQLFRRNLEDSFQDLEVLQTVAI